MNDSTLPAIVFLPARDCSGESFFKVNLIKNQESERMNPKVLLLFLQLSGITQQRLAEILGVSQATVFNWTKGTYEMKPTHYEALVDLIGEHNVFLLEAQSGSNEFIAADLKRRIERL
ncbi:helix-turn-helix domain-containing protein [Bacillus toyonensis]|uniref:helix-turn-helix domain-containing protein n=1 Tax=Bacillus toyonensis TaxID=155322 RepID=UPI00352AD099